MLFMAGVSAALGAIRNRQFDANAAKYDTPPR
jgi:hypothetical protein